MRKFNYLSKLKQPTHRAGIAQSKAYRALAQQLNVHLNRYDMSLAEWSLVGLVNEAGEPVRLSDVAQTLAIKQPVATNLVHQLTEKGIVTKQLDSSDGRARVLQLTQKGQQLAVSVEEELRASMKLLLKDVNKLELAIYISVLEQIAAKLDADSGPE